MTLFRWPFLSKKDAQRWNKTSSMPCRETFREARMSDPSVLNTGNSAELNIVFAEAMAPFMRNIVET